MPEQSGGWRYADDEVGSPAPAQSSSSGWRYATPDDLEPLTTPAEAFAYSAADAASLGWGDEASAFAQGIAGSTLGMGRYSDIYQQRVSEARGRLSRGRRDQQTASGLGTVAGSIAPLFIPGASAVASGRALPGGAALARAGAGRGLPAAMANMASGAYSGGIIGGIYGAGAANEHDRGMGLQDGALSGMAWGAAAPVLGQAIGARDPTHRVMAGMGLGAVGGGAIGAIMNPESPTTGAIGGALGGAAVGGTAAYAGRRIAEPFMQSMRNAWRNPRAAFGSGVGMSIGLPPISGGAAAAGGARRPPINPATVRAFDNLLFEEGIDVNQLRGRLGRAARTPMNRTWSDIFGKSGTLATRALAQGRGTTAALAETTAQRQAQTLSRRLINALTSKLGVKSTVRRADESLDAAYARISSDHYEPIFRDVPRVPAELRSTLQNLSQRFPNEILGAAEESMSRVALMRGEPRVMPGDTRFYHKLYSGLGQVIRQLERNPSAIPNRIFGPEDIAAMRALRREMRDAMDGIPGYREARLNWASLADAQDAIDEGVSFISGALRDDNNRRIWRPEDVTRLMSEMSPFEKQHFRIGVADELSRRFTMRAPGTGLKNSAEAFNIEGMQNMLREVFERPDIEGDAFMSILNEGNQLMRNAQTWGGNSSTFANFARAGGGFWSTIGDVFDVFGHPQRAAAAVTRSLRENAALADDNELGRALLSVVDGGAPPPRFRTRAEAAAFARRPETPEGQFRRALLRELRQLEQDRVRRGAGAAGEGAFSAVGGGNAFDQEY